MIPLKDDNPTSSKPIVTYFIIRLCILIFLLQINSQSYKTGQLFYSYGLIPSVLMGHDAIAIGSLCYSIIPNYYLLLCLCMEALCT